MKGETSKSLIKQQRLQIAEIRKTLLDKSPEDVDIDDVLRVLLSYGTSASTDIEALISRLQLQFGSYSQILDAHMEDLMRVEGVTENSATFIKLIASLASYCAQSQLNPVTYLRTTPDVGRYCASLFMNETLEKMYVIALDEHGKFMGKWIVGVGSVNVIRIAIRDVVRRCLQSGSCFAVITHNHPDGSLSPSAPDIRITKTIHDAIKQFNILLLDHIIVAGDQFTSLLAKGDYTYKPLGDDFSMAYMLVSQIYRIEQQSR